MLSQARCRENTCLYRMWAPCTRNTPYFTLNPKSFTGLACAEALSMHVAGVLDLKQAQEWVVTTKLGSSDKRPGTAATQPSPVLRFYASEMMMSMFVLTAALYGIFSVNKWSFSIFLTLQGAPRSSPALLPFPSAHSFDRRLGALGCPTQHPRACTSCMSRVHWSDELGGGRCVDTWAACLGFMRWNCTRC